MELKKKKCKGVGVAIGIGCSKLSLFRKYGLCNECLKYFYTNTPKEKEKLLKAPLKVSASCKSLEKAIKTNKETKGIATALKNTKKVVHEMVRLRDNGKPCISCSCQWNSNFQAGHCYPTRYRSIRFNFNNINGQCVGCNIGNDGNETQYLIQLPKRIGIKDFKKLKKLAELDAKFNKHWTIFELKEIRDKAKIIIKELTQ